MKISIITPTFNQAAFIEQAILSVLNQSFADFEFLIINDGSTDNSEKIILDYAAKDNRIIYLKNNINLGVQATLNKGLSMAKGDYIARIDSDDIWCDKDKLQKQFDFLEKNPDYALVGTAMETINENGKPLAKFHFLEADGEIRNRLLFSSQFAHPSVLIRTKALREIGSYSQKKKHKNIEDYELWLRLGTRYKFANLPDICLQYRINSEGLSLQNEFKQRLRGLFLTFSYMKYYPKGLKAIGMKIATLPLSRKTLDELILKYPLVRKMYAKITGTRKTI